MDNFSYIVVEGVDGEVWLGNCDGGVVCILVGKVDLILWCVGWCFFSVMLVYLKIGGGWWIMMGIGVFEMDVGWLEVLRCLLGLVNMKLVWVMYVVCNGDLWLVIDFDCVGLWCDGSFFFFGL